MTDGTADEVPAVAGGAGDDGNPQDRNGGAGQDTTATPAAPQEDAPDAAAAQDDLDPARCIVIVPVRTHVEEECAVGLAELQSRGYQIRQVIGQTAIDYARSKMASDALDAGFEEIMWIDSDIGFTADDVEMLRRHRLPVVSGIYPQKGQRALASHLLPETDHVVFGIGGGLIEIRYAAGGFLLTHRRVYETIREHEQLPSCNDRFGSGFTPYFWPMVIPDGDGHWYLAEDFAFCERVRRAGFAVMADTRIRLQHIGRAAYSWEDAGSELPRYASYSFSVTR
ncbi:MAG TPA: hypothetical protein VFP72_15680 [Kineosporiaceae bacterium]|nr:hypothetical protein [Kineosporiaceae bacterium]